MKEKHQSSESKPVESSPVESNPAEEVSKQEEEVKEGEQDIETKSEIKGEMADLSSKNIIFVFGKTI